MIIPAMLLGNFTHSALSLLLSLLLILAASVAKAQTAPHTTPPQPVDRRTAQAEERLGDRGYRSYGEFVKLGELTAIQGKGAVASIYFISPRLREEGAKAIADYFLKRNPKLHILNASGLHKGFFQSTEIEPPPKNAPLSTLRLRGLFQLRGRVAAVLGDSVGLYRQSSLERSKRLPRPQANQAKKMQKAAEASSQSGIRKEIRHPLDQKIMVYIGRDVVIFGQNSNPLENNFNPYFDDRSPLSVTRIGPFYMDKYEVTNAEYLHFCRKSGYPLPSSWQKSGRYGRGRGEHPFHIASYRDAEAYAIWSGKRLPRELEWEMAARGGLSLWMNRKQESIFSRPPAYPYGNQFSAQKCNTLESGRGDTLPVKALQDGSPYGIMGLCGNAREWTSSWYEPYFGHRFPAAGDLRGAQLTGNTYRMIRGGSFAQDRRYARSDYRDYGGIPTLSQDQSAGFRLVIDAH